MNHGREIMSHPCGCSNEAEDTCRVCNKPICDECSVEVREGRAVVPTCLPCARKQLGLDRLTVALVDPQRERGAA
jgi:hypothetical protein